MKILIGSSTPFHLGHIARELTHLGHDVTMIGYMPRIGTRRFFDNKIKYRSYFFYSLPFSFFALQKYSKRLKNWAIYFMMPIIDWFISRNIKDQDVFIGLSGVCLESFRKAKRNGILTICERGSSHVLTQMSVINNDIKKTFPKLYIDRELEGYNIVDFITIPSLFSKKTFINHNVKENRIFLNNYGVDSNIFKEIKNLKNKKDPNRINVLYVGDWSYQKGCDLLVQALNKLENMYLTHIGSRSNVQYPQNDRFTALGIIPNLILSKYYSKYDVFVLASRQDGFGMVLLEALSSGVPVIASTNTGGPDIKKIIENKNLVQIFKSENADQLISLLLNFKKLKFTDTDLSEVNKIKEYFTWSSYAKRYEYKILKSLKNK
tara:strand:+ start:4723 stop:5853 length:1131 start_codon:yes stop_codon:yes gene_type:complete